MYQNIEKSAFRKGEYVGHATGTWRIRRDGKGWLAIAGSIPGHSGRTLRGATLRDISKQLETVNAQIAQTLRAIALPNPFSV